jgi:hypothetical protein
MVRIRPHAYVGVPIGPPSAPATVAGCVCGWKGAASADPDANPDPGFHDWLSSHFQPFLEAGGLRGIVAQDNVSRLVEGFARVERIHWISNARRIIAVAWGWWSIINRTARAILVLSSVHQLREAVPLVRTVLEHTLFLEALERHGEAAVDAAVREHIRQAHNIATTVQGGPAFAGLLAETHLPEIPDPIPDAAWTQQVNAICGRLGVTNSLYLLYRTLCRYTHPTLAATDQFISTPETEDLGIVKEPRFTLDSDLLFWTGVMLAWAGQTMNRFLVQPILEEDIARAVQELGVVSIGEVSTSKHFGVMNVSSDRMDQIMSAT